MHDLDVLGHLPEPLADLLDHPDGRTRASFPMGQRVLRAMGISAKRDGRVTEALPEIARRARCSPTTAARWLKWFEAVGILVCEQRGGGTRDRKGRATTYVLPALKALVMKLKAKAAQAARNVAATASKLAGRTRGRVGRASDRKIKRSDPGRSNDHSQTRARPGRRTLAAGGNPQTDAHLRTGVTLPVCDLLKGILPDLLPPLEGETVHE